MCCGGGSDCNSSRIGIEPTHLPLKQDVYLMLSNILCHGAELSQIVPNITSISVKLVGGTGSCVGCFELLEALVVASPLMICISSLSHLRLVVFCLGRCLLGVKRCILRPILM